MPDTLPPEIENDEYLYRGIVENNWDFENNRPSSATFKDSIGVSVDRDNKRPENECVNFLTTTKSFFAVCKVKTAHVRELNGLVKYSPTENNPFHSEIHDSTERISLRGSKPKKIRDASQVIYRHQ